MSTFATLSHPLKPPRRCGPWFPKFAGWRWLSWQIVVLVGIVCLCLTTVATASGGKIAKVQLNDKIVQVEYVDTPALRARGLQGRTELCPDCGMLFHFGAETATAMWMKNTFLPLDVAFIKASGIIANIEGMEPMSLRSVPSDGRVLYALEMHRGWFARQGVQVGDSMQLLDIRKH